MGDHRSSRKDNCASFGKLVLSTRVVPHRAHSAALRSLDTCAAGSQLKNGRFPLCPQNCRVWAFAQQRKTVPPPSSRLAQRATPCAPSSILSMWGKLRTGIQQLPTHSPITTTKSPKRIDCQQLSTNQSNNGFSLALLTSRPARASKKGVTPAGVPTWRSQALKTRDNGSTPCHRALPKGMSTLCCLKPLYSDGCAPQFSKRSSPALPATVLWTFGGIIAWCALAKVTVPRGTTWFETRRSISAAARGLTLSSRRQAF